MDRTQIQNHRECFAFDKVRLQITFEPDPSYPTKRITHRGRESVVFYLRGHLPVLKQTVPNAFCGTLNLGLHGSFTYHEDDRPPVEVMVEEIGHEAHAHISARYGMHKQILLADVACENVRLRFCGDIDGDGIPDLLIGVTGEAGNEDYYLFVSNNSMNGSTWHLLATFLTTGC